MIRIKPLPMCPYRLKPHDKLYFLHVYKTAGTTFRMLLEDRFDRHEICPAHQIGELLRLPADRLVRYRLFWGHLGFKLADLMPEEMIYLTLLRDPIEHVLSIYHAVRREPAHILYDKVNRLGLSLDAFLRDEDAVTHVRNQQVFTLAWWHLIQDRLPETVALRREADRSFRSAPDDVLAELVLERLERFAFVGLTERMVDATRLLTYTLGWEPFDDVPRLNAAPERIRKDELAPATLEAIQDLTRQDARLYAHAGRLFEARFQRMLQAEQLAERAGCEAEGPSPLSREGRALRGADREETGPFWARVADDLRELSETRASLAEVRAELAASRRVYAELEAGAAAARRAYAELEAGAAAAHQNPGSGPRRNDGAAPGL